MLNYLHMPRFAKGMDNTLFNWTPAAHIHYITSECYYVAVQISHIMGFWIRF